MTIDILCLGFLFQKGDDHVLEHDNEGRSGADGGAPTVRKVRQNNRPQRRKVLSPVPAPLARVRIRS